MQTRIVLSWMAGLLIYAGFLTGCAAEKAPVEADRALQNVQVISMSESESEEIQRNRTVLIKGDRIVRIAEPDEITIPESAERIDGNGGYLMPGLSEMHAHIPSGDADRKYIEQVLFLYLSNGITTIRGMLGHPLHLKLREQAGRNELASPRIYTSGPGFSGSSAKSPEQARRMVREQEKKGYDFLKILPGLSLETYNAIAEEAQRVGIEFSGHVPDAVGLERALEAGQTTIDHLDQYPKALVADSVDVQQIEDPGVIYFGMQFTPYVDRDKIPDIARKTDKTGAWAVPTQALLEHVLGSDSPEELAQRPEFQYMSPQTVKEWINSKRSITGNEMYSDSLAQSYLQLRREIIKELYQQGDRLLLGSDAPQIFNVPGFSLHHELQYIVEAGLSPYEALRTGTYNAARYLKDLDNSGTIEEGKIADLVLLESNPLEDIANTRAIAGVMYRGKWLSKDEIESRLQAIAEQYQ